MTIAKSITKTLDISVEDVRIDLTATIRSYDLTDTQFIFEIKSSNEMTVNLTGGTAMHIVEYVHNSQTYAIQGDVNIIGTDTLSFNLPEDLKGYSGTVLIGVYVKLTDGTKIDIKDIAVRIEPSIMDKDIDFSAKTYFKDFEKVKAEVISEGEKAKTQIKQVLPSVKAEISEIKTDIENLPDIPDLFVAYADDLNGRGFSKTDTTKLYKGYGVKNSNRPADYRWERNVNNLQVGGRNYLLQKTGKGSANTTINADGSVTIDLSQNIDTFFKIYASQNLGFLSGKTVTLSFESDRETNWDFGFPESRYDNIRGINLGKNSYTFTFPNDVTVNRLTECFIDDIRRPTTTGTITLSKFRLEVGNTATDNGMSQEELILNSNPVNSILTTLSSENPSTTLGGTWAQLGTESKFSNTIYYWKRTD